MEIVKGFLYLSAAAFATGGVVLGLLLGKLTWILGAPVILGGLGLGWLTLKGARKFGQKQALHQGRRFEEIFRQLALHNGGSVAFNAIVTATGVEKEEAQSRLRVLMGQGVCEMDFGPNGELLYKLTPFNEAQAHLSSHSAHLREKN